MSAHNIVHNPPGGDTDQVTHAAMPDQEPAADHFRSKEIFDKIEALLADDGAAMVAKVKGVYLFRVKAGKDGAEGAWILDAKNGSGAVEFNGKGDVLCLMSDANRIKSAPIKKINVPLLKTSISLLTFLHCIFWLVR